MESPWGRAQPDPNFDRSMKIYELALTAVLRSPFAPVDELHPDAAKSEDDRGKAKDDSKKTTKRTPEEGMRRRKARRRRRRRKRPRRR